MLSTDELVYYVKSRYEWLKISEEQAWQIAVFEEEFNAKPANQYWSVWEEHDYHEVFFKSILSFEQFALYQSHENANLRHHEQTLWESDQKRSTDITYWKELNHYYETQFVPAFFKASTSFLFFFKDEKNKIDYLREEYKQYLLGRKWQTIVQHYRLCRQFQPNALELSLLGIQFAYILPDYRGFSFQLDESGKAIVQHLVKRYGHAQTGFHELFIQKQQEAQDFAKQLTDKYYPDPQGGWHVYNRDLSEEQKNEERLITLFLLEYKKGAGDKPAPH